MPSSAQSSSCCGMLLRWNSQVTAARGGQNQAVVQRADLEELLARRVAGILVVLLGNLAQASRIHCGIAPAP